MNVVRFMGGLGNQMFQYAIYYVYLKKHGRVLANLDFYSDRSDRAFLLNSVFPQIQIKVDGNHLFQRKRDLYLSMHKHSWIVKLNYSIPCFSMYFSEKESGVYDKRVPFLRSAAVEGYWQSELYIKKYEREIRDLFSFDNTDSELKKFAQKLEAGNYTSIHIRRGDYLEFEDIYGNICTKDYYEKAISYLKIIDSESKFVIVSDDIEWTKENISIDGAIYVNHNEFVEYKDWYDMYIMTCCRNNIIANSSFSWWGAWLNSNEKKIVIAPSKWTNGMRWPDICPKEWVRL